MCSVGWVLLICWFFLDNLCCPVSVKLVWTPPQWRIMRREGFKLCSLSGSRVGYGFLCTAVCCCTWSCLFFLFRWLVMTIVGNLLLFVSEIIKEKCCSLACADNIVNLMHVFSGMVFMDRFFQYCVVWDKAVSCRQYCFLFTLTTSCKVCVSLVMGSTGWPKKVSHYQIIKKSY